MSTPGTSLFVNADWSKLVPAGSVDAAFGLTVEDAKRRGLLPLEAGEQFAQPEILHSANFTPAPEVVDVAAAEPEPEPEVKQAPKPPNKAARKPRNK